MLNLKSLVAVAAISTVAMMSIAQAAGQPGRKTVHQPKIIFSEKVRGSHAEAGTTAPGVSYEGTRGLSAPAGRS
jgi:hypothetical protein